MKKVILTVVLAFSFLYSNTNITSIDIYNNKTILNQTLDLNKKSADLIGNVLFENIKFDMDKSCEVLDFDLKVMDSQKNELDNLIQNFEEKISKATNKIKALKSNIKFLEEFRLKKVEDIKVLSKSSSFLVEEISKSYDEIYSLENIIKEYKKELQELKKQTYNNKFTRVNYNIKCDKKDKVVISYPTYLVSVSRFNVVNYDTRKKQIELKNSAFVTQNSGVDFKNIEINFYVGSYFNLIKPYKFVPEYLDILQPPIALESADMNMPRTFIKTKAVRAASIQKQYIELSTKSVNKISNIDLKLGKKTKIELSNEKIDAKSYLEIDGYSTSNPFYKVDFTSKKLYPQSYAQFYIDDIFVGKGAFTEIKKDKKSSIYFSTNSFINVKKELIKDMKEEPFFSINILKTQKVWKYEIKNSSKIEQNITLLERVPVSKHEDIKVKVIGKTKYTKLDKDGKIHYDFTLKPNEQKIIEFGYEIEKPAKSK